MYSRVSLSMAVGINMHCTQLLFKRHTYRMAGKIGAELYLVVGKFKLGLPNFNPPKLFYCIKKSRRLNLLMHSFVNSTFLNTMTLHKFLRLKNANHYIKDVSLPYQ